MWLRYSAQASPASRVAIDESCQPFRTVLARPDCAGGGLLHFEGAAAASTRLNDSVLAADLRRAPTAFVVATVATLALVGRSIGVDCTVGCGTHRSILCVGDTTTSKKRCQEPFIGEMPLFGS